MSPQQDINSSVMNSSASVIVSADSTLIDPGILVLNDSETFGIFDALGDIHNGGRQLQGIFHQGSRYVSTWKLLLFGQQPLLLSSAISEDNDLLSADLTTPPLDTLQGPLLKGTVHLWRTKFIRQGICHETLTLTNHGQQHLDIPLTIIMDADFHDVFELRGFIRTSPRPAVTRTISEDGQFSINYRGLDQIERRMLTTMHFNKNDTKQNFSMAAKEHPKGEQSFQQSGRAELLVSLPRSTTRKVELTLTFALGKKALAQPERRQSPVQRREKEVSAQKNYICDVVTDNAHFNHWLRRTRTDMVSLLGRRETLWYPFAGVPWYNTVFGRDGLFTAMQMLIVSPEIARNVLYYLAKQQAKEDRPALDAEFGKILHEERHGELAAIGEVPFKSYYGSVDATPLFVWLAGLYYRRTADLELIRSIFPAIRAALRWQESNMAEDLKHGFLRYAKRNSKGLDNQGWKDSTDGISHQDGQLLQVPIALSEVQGYAYQAWLQAAYLMDALGEAEQSAAYTAKAIALKQHFCEVFWQTDWQYCYLAFDGQQQPAKVVSSNPGHCLAAEILRPQQAEAVAAKLFSDQLFSGWGIRTLGSDEQRYNPMSYHNGSVWPHDNAFIALGLQRYGFKNRVVQLANALFEASLFFPLQRLPELYCGFERRDGVGPTHYPVACSPQAWATGVPHQLLQALLGIEINSPLRTITVVNPVLPEFLCELEFRELPLPNGETVTLHFIRYRDQVTLEIAQAPKGWHIEVHYLP